jgi:hypothetical protein
VTIPVDSRITGGHTKTSEATAVEAAEAATLTTTTNAGAEMGATAVNKIAIRSVEAGAEALTETALLVEEEAVLLTPRTKIPRQMMAEVTDPLTGIGTSRTSQ